MENQIVAEFLRNIKKYKKITMLAKYVDLLMEINKNINLISRKSTEQDFWIKHIYDSILPAKYYNFNNSSILDFGTGGGLPGIPIKILFPTINLFLLDSVGKKIQAIKKISEELNLENCFFINERLENIKQTDKYDFILSRSVKMNKNYISKLRNMLKPSGKIILYKTSSMEETVKKNANKIIDVSNDILGSRILVEIIKNG